MSILKNSIILSLLLLSFFFISTSIGQTEYANIELDNSLSSVEDIQQISDQKGNTILVFQSKKHLQFTLIKPGGQSTSKYFKTKRRFTLIQSFNDEDYFYFFYQDKKSTIHLYKTEKHTLNEHFEKILPAHKTQKQLSELLYKGEFLAFKYSKKPFAIHTYEYKDGVKFKKNSQVFDNHKKENFFVGRMLNNKEFISVRMTLNPLTYHFYRYRGAGVFEKKSIQLRPLYDEIGIKGKHALPEVDFLSPYFNLNFHIEDEDIYLDLGQLISINSLKHYTKQPKAGVLRFNWEKEEAEILMAKLNPDWKFTGRSFILHDSLYFDLTTSKEKLDLSIYNIKNQKLLKNYAYSVEDSIGLIQSQPLVSSTSTMYMDLFSETSIPIKIKDKTYASISNEDLFKILSGENLYLDVFSDDSIIELQFSGVYFKNVVYEVRESVAFSGYLSKTNFEIVEESALPENTRWQKVDELIEALEKHQKDLELYISYESGGRLYLVYTVKNKNEARVIQF